MNSTIMFKVSIQSYTDVVTNSSSELFIINLQNNHQHVVNLLDSTLSDWRDEYYFPKLIHKLQQEDLQIYIKQIILEEYYSGVKKRTEQEKNYYYNVIRKNPYKYWMESRGIFEPTPFSLIEFFLDEDGNVHPGALGYATDLTSLGIEVVKDWIRKNEPNTYALFSINENPNWENQEKLMKIGSRYHIR